MIYQNTCECKTLKIFRVMAKNQKQLPKLYCRLKIDGPYMTINWQQRNLVSSETLVSEGAFVASLQYVATDINRTRTLYTHTQSPSSWETSEFENATSLPPGWQAVSLKFFVFEFPCSDWLSTKFCLLIGYGLSTSYNIDSLSCVLIGWGK